MQKITISAPLKHLECLIVSAFADIEAWLRAAFIDTPPPFYCSTDLRNNGNKIAPVDTNLFPSGFNNIPTANYPVAIESIRRQIDNICPQAKSILLITENHTRNMAYWDHIVVLIYLLETAGINVQLGRLDGQQITLKTSDGTVLSMMPVEKDGKRLHCGDFYPCAALLNNDLSAGFPAIFDNLETPILPSAKLGWATRRKSTHFHQYQRIVEQFSDVLNIDPWLMSADFFVCPKVNFHRREGMECLATAVEATLVQIREKYREHDISEEEPYVVIKADVGTYGMGVMTVDHAEKVFSLNRKQRNNMAVGKDGQEISDVLIQEGVRTLDTVNGAVAEPVVYLLGSTVAGGFYRANATRASNDNLNSRGMSFSPLPFETNCAPPTQNPDDSTAARLYVYSVVARLANLAAAHEQQSVDEAIS